MEPNHQADHPKSIFASHVQWKLWRGSLVVAGISFFFYLVYNAVYGSGFNLTVFANTIAATAAFLIAVSLALSGFCYYWDFLDTKIGYRKYLGLVGFWLALLYSVLLLFINPQRYWYGFVENFWSVDFIFGLSAMTILAFMALISNTPAMKKLGPQRWRRLLRLGYLAITLLIIRAFVMEHPLWLEWFQTLRGLPPPRLIVTLLALGALVLRGAMIVSKFSRRQAAADQVPGTRD